MIYFEQLFPDFRHIGFNIASGTTVSIAGTTTISGTTTFSGPVINTSLNNLNASPVNVGTPTAVNATATLTAAQIASGYITSTSGAAVTMTMPTGTLLGGYLGAKQGYEFEFCIDNTAGANTVTVAPGTNGIISAAAAAGSSANFGLVTVPSGVTGIGQFTIMFSSATAYVYSRTA